MKKLVFGSNFNLMKLYVHNGRIFCSQTRQEVEAFEIKRQGLFEFNLRNPKGIRNLEKYIAGIAKRHAPTNSNAFLLINSDSGVLAIQYYRAKTLPSYQEIVNEWYSPLPFSEKFREGIAAE